MIKAELGCLLLLLLLPACTPEQNSQPAPASLADPWFEEISGPAKLDFVANSGFAGHYIYPEIMIGGGALFDMDADGDLDLYLVQAGDINAQGAELGANRLFRNNGDLTFSDVTAGSGTADRAYGMGAGTGDYDNDGLTDLYLTNLGQNKLFHNNGDGTFTDVTESSGTGSESWSFAAAFFDYDKDGDLDLYVVNYINWALSAELECYNAFGVHDYCHPNNYNAPATDTLYRNNGDGTFTDVSAASGLQASHGNSLGMSIGDYDANGWLDVYVANDSMRNNLWLNQGDGRFIDEAFRRGCALDEHGAAKSGMGVTSADLDDDGDLDILVGNMVTQSDSYYRNEGGFFSDRTAIIGLGMASRAYTRYGLGFADFDNDGSLDLYQANGNMVISAEPLSEDLFAQPNLLFKGVGGRFEAVQPQAGVTAEMLFTSRAAIFGDLDNDGGVDVIVVNKDGQTHVFHNIVKDRGHWLSFRVLDVHGRNALGASVYLDLDGRQLRREVATSYSYLAAHDPRVHFGLGDQPRALDVTVQWVDGSRESFGAMDADRIVTLRRTERTD